MHHRHVVVSSSSPSPSPSCNGCGNADCGKVIPVATSDNYNAKSSQHHQHQKQHKQQRRRRKKQPSSLVTSICANLFGSTGGTHRRRRRHRPSSSSRRKSRPKSNESDMDMDMEYNENNHNHKVSVTKDDYNDYEHYPRKYNSNNNNNSADLWEALSDLDSIATLIQTISLVIIMGCLIVLTSKFVGGGEYWTVLDIFGLSTGSYHQGVHHGVGLNGHYPKVDLTPSKLYTIPNSMSHIGDKSDQYAILRREFDRYEQEEEENTEQLPIVTHEFAPTPIQTSDMLYDIYNCPDEPPSGYPFAWNLLEILKAWPPDNPTPPPQVHQGLCVFGYQTDLEKANTYRRAEVPFVIRNDPQVNQAARRWNAPGYMERLMGNVKHRAEYSESNHFLYWNAPPKGRRLKQQEQRKKLNHHSPFLSVDTPQGWQEPTQMMRMTYSEWFSHANQTNDELLGPDQPHWYFRLIGCGETGPEGQCDAGSSEYLFDELPFFQPKESIYITDPTDQKGIHCRFGMKGVIAENHFDGSRNAIVVLGGARRYILSHPDQCPLLSLLPKGHPSARHSAVDWSNPDLQEFPEFATAQANEVVLQAGDVLYLPTNWFHYIVSLTLNFQCNTRSGISPDYMEPIHECGF